MEGLLINPEIRIEQKEDYDQITKVNNLAFNQTNEGILVSRLRETDNFISELSLVAEFQNKLIGYILFYPLDIISGEKRFEILSLAPMAVLPEFQKRGIGSKLIDVGLLKALQLSFNAIVVLGHPEYYQKFGFERASKWKIKPPIEVPDEAFMAIEFVDGWLNDKAGVVEYPTEYYEAL
jgi:predicted N-acetyltransferase YhbS